VGEEGGLLCFLLLLFALNIASEMGRLVKVMTRLVRAFELGDTADVGGFARFDIHPF